MGKLLSIVIPTLNRCEYLKRTLTYMLKQVERNINDVEIIVCCNACSDGTDSYMNVLKKKKQFIRYYYFNEYVEVGQSIIRSVEKAEGDYIIMWGDDDIPFPYLVDYILSIISSRSDVGIIHLNRLQGRDTVYGLSGLFADDKEYSEEFVESDLDSFVQKHTLSLGFMSSLVFKKNIWKNGLKFYSDQFFGYEFLPVIVKGAPQNVRCLYCNFPMEIQRNPYHRDFETKWALYHFIGVPSMMDDFDKSGITSHALESWNKQYNASFVKFIWNLMYTSLNRTIYKPRCKEINYYQKSIVRKIITYLIVYTFPKRIFVLLKSKIYRKK